MILDIHLQETSIKIPEYNDDPEGSFGGLLYYQTRWCKHIYAALWSMKHDEGNDQFQLRRKISTEWT